MKIIEYFEDSRKEHWKKELATADWRAAIYLLGLLEDTAKFNEYLGEGGKLFLLVDGEQIVSFATLSPKDCIPDESLFPWIGFVYTYPVYRGHRYSEKVIRYAEKQARKDGHAKIYIATDHTNLYEKYGFTYMDTRVDCWNEESKVYYKDL